MLTKNLELLNVRVIKRTHLGTVTFWAGRKLLAIGKEGGHLHILPLPDFAHILPLLKHYTR